MRHPRQFPTRCRIVLVKNAEALETMEKVTTVIVDKTGTLTEGKPRLTKAVPASGIPENELLQIAASLERHSEHPLAAAIVRGAEERKLKLENPEQFNSVTGGGVVGRVRGREVAIGNARFPPRQRRRRVGCPSTTGRAIAAGWPHRHICRH